NVVSRYLVVLSYLSLVAIISIYLLRSFRGLWFLDFVDEAEHIVGGYMLNHGGRLYDSFPSQHGMTPFMLTQLFDALFGLGEQHSLIQRVLHRYVDITHAFSKDRVDHLAAQYGPNLQRVMMIALALIATTIFARIPSSTSRNIRFASATLF